LRTRPSRRPRGVRLTCASSAKLTPRVFGLLETSETRRNPRLRAKKVAKAGGRAREPPSRAKRGNTRELPGRRESVPTYGQVGGFHKDELCSPAVADPNEEMASARRRISGARRYFVFLGSRFGPVEGREERRGKAGTRKVAHRAANGDAADHREMAVSSGLSPSLRRETQPATRASCSTWNMHGQLFRDEAQKRCEFARSSSGMTCRSWRPVWRTRKRTHRSIEHVEVERAQFRDFPIMDGIEDLGGGRGPEALRTFRSAGELPRAARCLRQNSTPAGKERDGRKTHLVRAGARSPDRYEGLLRTLSRGSNPRGEMMIRRSDVVGFYRERGESPNGLPRRRRGMPSGVFRTHGGTPGWIKAVGARRRAGAASVTAAPRTRTSARSDQRRAPRPTECGEGLGPAVWRSGGCSGRCPMSVRRRSRSSK